MLGLLIVTIMAGHKGYTSIATWGRCQPSVAKALGFKEQKTPCAATLHNLLKRLDGVRLEQTLTKWIAATLARQPAPSPRLVGLAIDGKALSGSQIFDAKPKRAVKLIT